MHHDKGHRPPFRFSAFCRTSTVSEHSKFRETCRCITHGNVLNLWHHDSFLHIFEQHHVQNEQLDSPDNGLVSSVVFIQPLFVSVSPSVLLHHSHTSSSCLTKPSSSFSESGSTPKHCKGASPLAPVVWQIPSFSILCPSPVGHKLELIMVVPRVLFVVDESGVTELLFHDFPLIFDADR